MSVLCMLGCLFFFLFTVIETHEGMTDTYEITNLIKNDKGVGFLYLSPAVPKSSVKYHYYNLKYVLLMFVSFNVSLPIDCLYRGDVKV